MIDEIKNNLGVDFLTTPREEKIKIFEENEIRWFTKNRESEECCDDRLFYSEVTFTNGFIFYNVPVKKSDYELIISVLGLEKDSKLMACNYYKDWLIRQLKALN